MSPRGDGPPGYGYLSRPDQARVSGLNDRPRPPMNAQGLRAPPTGPAPGGLPADGTPRIGIPPRLEGRRVMAAARTVTQLLSGIDDPDTSPPLPWVPDGEAYAATFTPDQTADPDGGNAGATLIENNDFDGHHWLTPVAAHTSDSEIVEVEIHG